MTVSPASLTPLATVAPNTASFDSRKLLAGGMALPFFLSSFWVFGNLAFGYDFLPIKFDCRASLAQERPEAARFSLDRCVLSVVFALFFWFEISALIFRSAQAANGQKSFLHGFPCLQNRTVRWPQADYARADSVCSKAW
jgi:hypothetical protein